MKIDKTSTIRLKLINWSNSKSWLNLTLKYLRQGTCLQVATAAHSHPFLTPLKKWLVWASESKRPLKDFSSIFEKQHRWPLKLISVKSLYNAHTRTSLLKWGILLDGLTLLGRGREAGLTFPDSNRDRISETDSSARVWDLWVSAEDWPCLHGTKQDWKTCWIFMVLNGLMKFSWFMLIKCWVVGIPLDPLQTNNKNPARYDNDSCHVWYEKLKSCTQDFKGVLTIVASMQTFNHASQTICHHPNMSRQVIIFFTVGRELERKKTLLADFFKISCGIRGRVNFLPVTECITSFHQCVCVCCKFFTNCQ